MSSRTPLADLLAAEGSSDVAPDTFSDTGSNFTPIPSELEQIEDYLDSKLGEWPIKADPPTSEPWKLPPSNTFSTFQHRKWLDQSIKQALQYRPPGSGTLVVARSSSNIYCEAVFAGGPNWDAGETSQRESFFGSIWDTVGTYLKGPPVSAASLYQKALFAGSASPQESRKGRAAAYDPSHMPSSSDSKAGSSSSKGTDPDDIETVAVIYWKHGGVMPEYGDGLLLGGNETEAGVTTELAVGNDLLCMYIVQPEASLTVLDDTVSRSRRSDD